MSDKTPALLALDWGTSSLRAYRMAADGGVLEHRSRPWGILSLPEGGFRAAFDQITDGWSPDGLPCIACGMVGSRQGWKQVGYLDLPCGPGDLAAALERLEPGNGVGLHLVPGLLDRDGPDVMRGEETQAAGAMDMLGRPDESLVLVMPGTHSKWVTIEAGRLRGFSTIMTGELFGLLRRHSILATTEPDNDDTAACDQAFEQGVRAAAADGLSLRLFGARSLVLTGRLEASLTGSYLSGLLIGEELARALPHHADRRIVLVGDPALTDRYRRAFAILERPVDAVLDATAPHGLFRIARDAGLIHR